MKIIKRVEPEFPTKKIVRPTCTSVLEYNVTDIKSRNYYHCLICPVCKFDIILSEEQYL